MTPREKVLTPLVIFFAVMALGFASCYMLAANKCRSLHEELKKATAARDFSVECYKKLEKTAQRQHAVIGEQDEAIVRSTKIVEDHVRRGGVK